MELMCEFETVDLGDESIVVPIGCPAGVMHGVIRMNGSAIEILEIIKNADTFEDIISELSNRYENDVETLEEYVIEFLKELQDFGFIK